MSSSTSAIIGSTIDLLKVARRIREVQLECRDALEVLDAYCTSDSFAFIDPPYVLRTRVDKRGYQLELPIAGHVALATKLIQLHQSNAGRFILSGYYDPVYACLEDVGWLRIEVEIPCHGKGRTRVTKLMGKGAMANHRRLENLWIDPTTASELSDSIEREG